MKKQWHEKINIKMAQRRWWELKFRDDLRILRVSQQGRLAYLDKELVVGKGNRVTKRPVMAITQVQPSIRVEDMV